MEGLVFRASGLIHWAAAAVSMFFTLRPQARGVPTMEHVVGQEAFVFHNLRTIM